MVDDNLTKNQSPQTQGLPQDQGGGSQTLPEQPDQNFNQPLEVPSPENPNLGSQLPPVPELTQEPVAPLPQTELPIPTAEISPAQYEPFGSEVLPPEPKLAGEYPQTPPMIPGSASEQLVASDLNQPPSAIFQTQPPPPETVSQSPTTVFATGSASRLPKIGLKVLSIVVLVLFLAGGGASAFYFLVWQKGGEQTETSQSQKPQTTQSGGFGNLLPTPIGNIPSDSVAPTIAPTTSPRVSAKEQLLSLVSKAEGVGELSYEMVKTISGKNLPEGKSVTNVWQKGQKLRTDYESGGRTIWLEDFFYLYDSQTDVYLKAPISPQSIETFQNSNVKDFLNRLKGSSEVKEQGSEELDDKTAEVYVVTLIIDQVQRFTKVWLWEEKGLPLKSETTVDASKTVVEYKNYLIDKVDDSVFAIPPEKIVGTP